MLKAQLAGSLMGLALGLSLMTPSLADARVEQGNPELYDNGALVPGKTEASSQIGFGQFHFESAQLGSEGMECVDLGFGSGWNEGDPPRAVGQVLLFESAGHVPENTHPQTSPSCRPETTFKPASFVTPEAYVKSEENASKEVEPSLRHISTPWNVEVNCGVRSEEYVATVKLGVPTSEFPHAGNPPCPASTETGQAEEEEAYKKEREAKSGCYASNPGPEGCIRVTIVEPGAGLEVAYGGTLRAQMLNGVRNGLFPTKWQFEGATSGELQCEFPAGCVATGRVTGDLGEDEDALRVGLIQAK